ncbi:hypothetical protein FJZ36_16340 [Candidatus Poribacteria bacterium]|nr:hypothetical protein [Candidatus Poribacteria bacterium]
MTEMTLYRSRIRLRSPSGTKWQADTLFGHWCWWRVRRAGEEGLCAALGRYVAHEPLFLLSDGFPAGSLPRPMSIAPPTGDELDNRPKPERVDAAKRRKADRDRLWLTVDGFNAARNGDALEPRHFTQPAMILHSRTMNQIDRRTGTAGSEGGQLFQFTEHWIPVVDIYWKILPEAVSLVTDFLDDLRRSGYGRRRSIGYGAIHDIDFAPCDAFAPVQEPNGFVTLSRFVPAQDDPTDGAWRLAVKYGKLGEELANRGRPFKKPIIQIEAGAVFRTAVPRSHYGRLIEWVIGDDFPDRENPINVVHYGFAFPMEARLPTAS